MNRAIPFLAQVCVIAWFASLPAGCENRGFHDAEIAKVKKEISEEFARRNWKVTDMALSRDSQYQLSGVVTYEHDTPMGVRSHATQCSATMERDSRRTSWKCEKVE